MGRKRRVDKLLNCEKGGKRTREVHGNDIISNFERLSDDLMIDIMGRLELNDAVKLSVLSQRLHRLWESTVEYKKNLDFEDTTHRGQRPSRLKFEAFVNNVLRIHKGSSSVHSLRISMSTGNVRYKGFDNWLVFARTKCVEDLEIDFTRWVEPPFPRRFPPFFSQGGWDKLRSLSLKSVGIHDADLELGLKSGLVNLESLFVEGAMSLERVVVSSLTLKRLEFRKCRPFYIDIDFAPNLEYFKSKNSPRLFNHVPKLSHVVCDYYTVLYVPKTRIEKLNIEMSIREYSRFLNREFPLFENLKELKLTFSLDDGGSGRYFFNVIFTDVLDACPQLYKLTLKIKSGHDHAASWRISEKDCFLISMHRYLKVVEFIGWPGRKNEVQGANYLKQISPDVEIIYRPKS